MFIVRWLHYAKYFEFEYALLDDVIVVRKNVIVVIMQLSSCSRAGSSHGSIKKTSMGQALESVLEAMEGGGGYM